MSRRRTTRLLLPVAFAAILVAGSALPTLAAGPAGAVRQGVDASIRARVAVPPAAITPGEVNRTSLALTASYRVTLALRYGSRAFNVDSTATIINTSGTSIDRIEFNTIAARLGRMTLKTVAVDDRRVTARVSDQTVIVPLGGVLTAGASVKVRVQYASTLRSTLGGSDWLFTKANGIVDAYRWIPWVSRATPFTRPNHGDPFVTPVSPLVRLKVQTDRRLVIASSADLVAVSTNGLTQTFEARNVRDVTITAAPDLRSRSALVGATRVSYHYRSGTNASRILNAAVSAFRSLQSRLGPYPYPTFKVVQSAGGYGMESPKMIWIPYGTGTANLRYLVAHETAHQWFYGLVGNDQARQPFVDEALADFVARDITGTRRASRCATKRLDQSIYGYTSACYYEVIYIQGGNLINQARAQMGSSLFWTTLREYVDDQRFKIVSTPTLLRTLDAATPVDLSRLFRPRFPRFY